MKLAVISLSEMELGASGVTARHGKRSAQKLDAHPIGNFERPWSIVV